METKYIHNKTKVPLELHGERLDRSVAILMSDYSRTTLQQWIKQGNLTVNGRCLKPKDRVASGDCIELHVEIVSQNHWHPSAISLDIVYEDEAILIINKPAGLVVHPGAGNYQDTLLNALLHYHSESRNLPRAGIVHRLDKDTSGVLVVAKTLEAQKHLVDQLQNRTMGREYKAIVSGVITTGGKVEQPIARHPVNRLKMAVVREGKPALTYYAVIQRFSAHTYINLKLHTGRTHQIRVHMQHIRFPLLGDPLYGGRLVLPKNASVVLRHCLQTFKRQALHAEKLSLLHPVTGEAMSWVTDLPDDMRTLLKLLRQENCYDRCIR